jgi:hypothetical protein
MAFRRENGVGTQDNSSVAAQWLADAHPYRRFTAALADDDARLGADADRFSFIAGDLHHLLPAGLPAHSHDRAAQGRRANDNSGIIVARALGPLISVKAGRNGTGQPRLPPAPNCD